MAEIFTDWTHKHGESDELDVWRAGLKGITDEQLKFGVKQAADSGKSFSPNLPEFKDMCLGSLEKRLGLAGRELSFPYLHNFMMKRGEKNLEELNPALYWMYKKILESVDAYNWLRMDTRQARAVFNEVYNQCLEAAAKGEEMKPYDPSTMLESPICQLRRKQAEREEKYKEKRKDPAYISKRKAAGRAAMDEMKAMMGGRA